MLLNSVKTGKILLICNQSSRFPSRNIHTNAGIHRVQSVLVTVCPKNRGSFRFPVLEKLKNSSGSHPVGKVWCFPEGKATVS